MKENTTPNPAISQNEPLSDNERIKSTSHFLRGTISQDLQTGITGGFNADNIQLIKFHGLYQQDDRDIRLERQAQKLEPRHHLMFRARLPGGIIQPEQWLLVDQLADDTTLYGSIRLTTRQTFQFHGILKQHLKTVFQALDTVGIDSKFTAGDVNRNVLCTPNPVDSKLHQEAYQFAKQISEHLLPQTQAYAEVWLDKEKVYSNEQEPIYGDTYLPRKFKTALAIPPHNDIDIYANDLGFIAIGDAEKGLIGFNVCIGGGLGMTHGDKTTFPRLASLLGFIPKEAVLAVTTAVVTTQRDYGNRSNRRLSKLKHTIETHSLAFIKAEIEKRAGIQFAPTAPFQFTERGDRLGWIQGHDGLWHYTLFIDSGRILDTTQQLLKTALREIAKIHQGDFRITANQNLIIANITPEQKPLIESLLTQYALHTHLITPLKQQAMACVSLPTCPLAMAEAERFMPEFVGEIQQILNKHQMENAPIVARVTGCPNGCARAMLAEIGLVGKAPNRYNLHIGGSLAGDRIPRLYKENITSAEIFHQLDILIEQWSKHRQDNEPFGDFVIRAGIIAPVVNSAKDFY